MSALDGDIKEKHAHGERSEPECSATRPRREDYARRDHAEEAKRVDGIRPLVQIQIYTNLVYTTRSSYEKWCLFKTCRPVMGTKQT